MTYIAVQRPFLSLSFQPKFFNLTIYMNCLIWDHPLYRTSYSRTGIYLVVNNLLENKEFHLQIILKNTFNDENVFVRS